MPPTLGTDIIIHRNGGPIAGVEVKNREDLSPDLAANLRRNMLAHHVIPAVPFFLLVSEDKAYLWTEQDRLGPEAPPSYELSMKRVVERFFPDRPSGRLRGAELELLVFIWLGELSGARNGLADKESPLALSGFADAIRGATITRAVA